MTTLSTDDLVRLRDSITPTMDGLRRIRAEEWGVDMPGDGSWTFVGKRDDHPRLIVIETGCGASADRRQDAIEKLCIIAPDLLDRAIADAATIAAKDADLIRLRGEVEAMGWRPIETAPTGSVVLGFSPLRPSGLPRRSSEAVTAMEFRQRRWSSVPGGWDLAPTHWMPLPAAPTTGESHV